MNTIKRDIETTIDQMTHPDNTLHLAAQLQYLADLINHSWPAPLTETISLVQDHIRCLCEEHDQMHSVVAAIVPYTQAESNMQVLHQIASSFDTSNPALVLSTLYDMSEGLRMPENGLYIRHPVKEHEALDALAEIDSRFAYTRLVVQDGVHAILLPSMSCKPIIEHVDLPDDGGVSTRVFIAPDTGRYGSGAYQAIRSAASAIVFYCTLHGSSEQKDAFRTLMHTASPYNESDLDAHELQVEMLTYGLAYMSSYWTCICDSGQLPHVPADMVLAWGQFLEELLPM